MFDLDQFIADCRAALAADKSPKMYVRSWLARSQTPLPFSKDWENQSGLRSRSSTTQAI